METTTAALSVEHIAKICHQANKAYCESIGDMSQKSWEEAEQWQRDSAVAGVQYRMDNPGATPEGQHESWKKAKEDAGWAWGEVKNAELKTHPQMVPYDQLPEEQKKKDALFQAVVDALTRTSVPTEALTVVSDSEYTALKKDQAFLRSLQSAGVDNWSGYSHAQDSFKENYPEYQEA